MRAAALLLALAGCTGDDAPAEVVGVPHEGVLADGRFAFCHEEGADADQLARWCALLAEAPPDVCPGMRATCLGGDFSAAPAGCLGGGFGERGRIGGLPGEPEEPWRRDPSQGCERAEAPDVGPLAEVLRWGAALLVAALVLLVARLLLVRLGWLSPRPPPSARPLPAATLDPIEGDDDLPALPEDELLGEARRALAAGRLGEAVVWARGAALRRLARRGALRLHRARTDREYLRTLRREPAAAQALATIVAAVEDHRWAGRVLTPDRASAAVEAAARLLAALLLGCLLLPGEALAGRRYAPHGDAALIELAREAGWRPLQQLSWLAEVDDTIDVVVLDTWFVEPRPEDWEALEAWVHAGGLLVLAGASGERFPELGRHVRFTGADPTDLRGTWWLDQAGVAAPSWPGGPTYMFCDRGGVPLVELPASAPRLPVDAPDDDCSVPAVVQVLPAGEGQVIALADAMVLRNGAMVVEANRRFLFRVLAAGQAEGWWTLPEAPVAVFATTAGARGSDDPLEAVTDARLLPFVLHLLAGWALLALAVGWPMSPLRDRSAERRRDFTEHAAALGRRWADAGARRHAAAAFARLELRRLGSDGLAAATVRAGRDPAQARAFVRRVEALADDPDGPETDDDHHLVEELWSITRHRST